MAPADVRIDGLPLAEAPDEGVSYLAYRRVEPAEVAVETPYLRELVLDPYTGAVLRRRYIPPRLWPVTRENFTALLFELHYALAMGRFGIWLFGIAAMVWTIDCFIGAYLTFPLRRRPDARQAPNTPGWWSRWRPAWWVRWRSGAARITFDLHRAGGLWVWTMLLIYAWSSVGLNLGAEVYEPVMGALFDMHRDGNDLPARQTPLEHPALSYRDAYRIAGLLAERAAAAHGARVLEASEIAYDPSTAVYFYAFRTDRDIGDYGGSSIAIDGETGALRSASFQDRNGFGAWLTDWLNTLHFGAIWGLPMKVFVCVMGLMTAMLSATGVWLWWRKRRTRVRMRKAHDIAPRPL